MVLDDLLCHSYSRDAHKRCKCTGKDALPERLNDGTERTSLCSYVQNEQTDWKDGLVWAKY